jgi:HD-GYP domain-containing protein (c-di-GMP phosphodiesterase class II)
MKNKDEKQDRRTIAEEQKALSTDAYTGRLIERVRQEMDTLKIKTMRATLDALYASFETEERTLLDCYTRVVAMFDRRACTTSVVDAMYAVYAILTMLKERFSTMLPHTLRVSTICMDIGRTMGLNAREVTVVGALGILHDVGKLGLSDAVIAKEAPLTAQDWEDIKRHAAIGGALIRPIGEISELADLILSHHERWDGKGYPQGLKGEEIPLLSRILTLADSVDAMISDRFYRKALSPSSVVTEVVRCRGTQFDPGAVDTFFKMIRDGSHSAPSLFPLREAVKML